MSRKEISVYAAAMLFSAFCIWMGSGPHPEPVEEIVFTPTVIPFAAINEAQAEADRDPWEDEPGGDALPYGASQSRGNAWAKARDAYKKTHPTCAACGCAGPHIAIHHILAWRNCTGENEWKRLDHSNLIGLCVCGGTGGSGSDGSGKHNCHWVHGHLGLSWMASNPNVRADAERFRQARIEAARQLELEKNPDASDPRNCE